MSQNRRRRNQTAAQRGVCEALENRTLLAAAVAAVNLDGQPIHVLPEINGQSLLAATGENSTTFYSTDGTQAGTVEQFTIAAIFETDRPKFVHANGRIFFTATGTSSGTELWATDGTAQGTTLLDIAEGAYTANPFYVSHLLDDYDTFDIQIDQLNAAGEVVNTNVVQEFGLTVYAYSPNYNPDLPSGYYTYRVRGTFNGETSDWQASPSSFFLQPASGKPNSLVTDGNEVYFQGRNSLYQTDGTPEGTSPILTSEAGVVSATDVDGLTVFDGHLVFSGLSGTFNIQTVQISTGVFSELPVRGRVIGVVNHQLVIFHQSETHFQFSKYDAIASTPELFYETPIYHYVDDGAEEQVVVPRVIDEFVVEEDRFSLTFRDYQRHERYSFTIGRHTPSGQVDLQAWLTATRIVSDLTTAGTVIANSMNDISILQHSWSQSDTSWFSLDAAATFPETIRTNGQTWYVGTDNELTTANGTSVALLTSRSAPLMAIDGLDLVAIGYPEGSEIADLLRINAATGRVTPLDVPVRDPSMLNTALDEVFVRSTRPNGDSLLLKLDDDATSVVGPKITSPAASASLPRDTVSVTWDAVTNAVSYDLLVLRNGLEHHRVVAQTETEFTFLGTMGDYELRIFANFADGTASGTSIVKFDVQQHSGVAIIGPAEYVSPTEGDVTLWWSRSVVQTYDVLLERLWDDGSVTTYFDWTDVTETLRYPYLPAGEYRLTVTGHFDPTEDSNFEEEQTDAQIREFTVTAGPVGPNIVTPSAGSELVPGSTTVTWEAVPKAVSYDMYVRSFDNGITRLLLVEEGLTGASKTIPLAFGNHTVDIRARFADGSSSRPSVQSCTVADAGHPVLVPSEVTLTSSVPLRLTRIDGALGYHVWVSEAGKSAYKFGEFDARFSRDRTSTFFEWAVPTDMPPGNYTVFLRARISGSETAAAAVGDEYTSWSPGYPIELFSDAVEFYPISNEYQGSQNATFTWKEAVSDSTYDLAIYRKSDGEQVYRNSQITGTTFTVPTALDAGEVYDVWMRAAHPDGGRSRWGNSPLEMHIIGNLQPPALSFDNNILSFDQPHVVRYTDIEVYETLDGGNEFLRAIFRVQGTGQIMMTEPIGDGVVKARSYFGSEATATTEISINVTDERPLVRLNYEAGVLSWDRSWRDSNYRLVIHAVDENNNIVHDRVAEVNSYGITFLPVRTWKPELPSGRFMATLYDANGAVSETEVFEVGGVADSRPVITTTFASTTSRRPTFEWTDASAASKYEITFRDANDNVVLHDENVAGLSYTPDQDLPTGRLWFTVLGHHSDGSSTLVSRTHSFQVAHPAVTIVGQGDGGLDSTPEIQWQAAGVVTSYSIVVRNTTTNTVILNLTGYTETSYEVATALTDGTYSFVVTADYADGGTSASHGYKEFSVGNLRPALSVVNDVATWISVAGATRYEVWVNSLDAQGNTVTKVFHETQLSETSVSLAALADGPYKAWVRAVRDDGGMVNASWWSRAVTFQAGDTSFDTTIRPDLTVSGRMAQWAPVQSAIRYELWINEVDDRDSTIRTRVIHTDQLTATTSSVASLSTGRYAGWLRAIGLNDGQEVRSYWGPRILFDVR